MLDLTIIVLTYNEEKNLPDCLQSLQAIPAPVFVVDSFSTDSTISILKEKNITHVQHPFVNYSVQRNWSQSNDPFQSSWVLHLDADERLSEELKKWLIHDFSSYNEADGFIFSRRAVFMDKWIRYGGHYPNRFLKLYKKSLGKCEDKAYDQHFICEGKKVIIPNKDIINILSDNLGRFIDRHNTWSLMEAIEILKQERSGEVKSSLSGNPIERKRWMKNNLFEKSPLFLRSFFYFIYRYIFRLGFLDGRQGLIFHVLQGFWFRFLVDAKVYEIRKEMKEMNMPLEAVIKNKYGLGNNG
jgi:glycosyltransferase involved in cell wall biosynthesis